MAESRLKTRARAAMVVLFPPLSLFALNAWICWRLFHTEYLDQMQSIEGAFISLATYIGRHWPRYEWFPVWYSGMPFVRAYQLGLHYAVALAANALGLSAAAAYHLVTGIAYSLGAVTFYYLARSLGGGRAMAFWAALMFSLFSPSTLLFPAVRRDVGGFLNARRLQALVVYGEGPNVTGLMLAMLALALLHRALEKRTPGSLLLASLATATVPVVNWTATMALLIGLAAYVGAGEWREIRVYLPRLLLAGAAAAALAFPFALPSTIRNALIDTVTLDDIPTTGAVRWISFGLLVLGLAAVRTVLIRWRAPFGPRFAALYFVLAGWVVAAAAWTNVRLTPNPMRFHLAMEIPMILTAAFGVSALSPRRSHARRLLTLALIVLCGVQAVHYRKYARSIVRQADITNKVEYQEAQWLDANMKEGRVMLPGATAFWAGAFTNAPQMTGCCVPSLNSAQPLITGYVIFAGYGDDTESADYSLLWLKAFAVDAVAMGGPNSREYYKDFRHPYRFQDRLPLLWRSGDDFIYRVPERAPGLARVVPTSALVRHPPVNGIDVTELRAFVQALDDRSLPVADFAWTDTNTAHVTGVLSAGQVLSIAVTWDPGWSATANGQAVPVCADGIGLIAVDPNCAGPCQVRLSWSPGLEPRVAIAVALLTLIALTGWCLAARFGVRRSE